MKLTPFGEASNLYHNFRKACLDIQKSRADVNENYNGKLKAEKMAELDGQAAHNKEVLIDRLKSISAKNADDCRKDLDFYHRQSMKQSTYMLKNMLSLDIDLTKEELISYAEMDEIKNDPLNSRMLHDYAARHGYELNNYVSMNQRLSSVDNFLDTIISAIDKGDEARLSSLDALLDDDYVQKMNTTIEPDFSCMDLKKDRWTETTRATADSIARDAANREKDTSFLDGFFGRVKPAESTNDDSERDLDSELKALTLQQTDAAIEHARHRKAVWENGKMIITAEDIDYAKGQKEGTPDGKDSN